ncbi:uncharacterized protein At4g26485-like [Malania oleifera]|uniref:uncharacterized protein At4g26485-like n=1 Tax=Malania oleifera TaxID=397392 RepID=UPI0025AEC685|nr:uncharacterized protein At4g26485-like [Malania oleifera]XP_057983371.1 uncharacterized protein At4g26485-like [Malania oleifera]
MEHMHTHGTACSRHMGMEELDQREYCGGGGKEETKWIKHYSSSHRILLVGEGNFSFAASLANAFGSASNIFATSLDSKDDVMRKHPSARGNLERLESLECTIIHEVDAHTMSLHPSLSRLPFDRIVFNFPHAGFILPEHNQIQIRLHQKLVKGFFGSAGKMLAEGGEVHVTHKTTYPFSEWKIEELAGECGLSLVERVEFCIWDYPDYKNKRGASPRSDGAFPVGQCSTFKFSKSMSALIT